MKELVEIFQWQFEGERMSACFVVDNIEQFEKDICDLFKYHQYKTRFIFCVIEDIVDSLEKLGYMRIHTNFDYEEKQMVSPRYYIDDDGITKSELTTKRKELINIPYKRY
jgi:hypothetical protein